MEAPRIVRRIGWPSSSAKSTGAMTKLSAIVAVATAASSAMNPALFVDGSTAWKITAAKNDGVVELARLISSARQR